MATARQRWEEGGGRVGGNKERKKGEMEVVISAVFTCSSHGCLAETSPCLATDLPCQSASPCVYHAALCRMGETADRVPASCSGVQLRRCKHHLSFAVNYNEVIFSV